MDDDKTILTLWRSEKSPRALQRLIERYEGPVFSFVLQLTGCDLNMAYETTAESFAGVLSCPEKVAGVPFSVAVFSAALEECTAVKDALFFDSIELIDAEASKKNGLRTVTKALSSMTFEERALLLLRDLAHLSYIEIAAVMDVDKRDIKSQTMVARNVLREKIEKEIAS